MLKTLAIETSCDDTSVGIVSCDEKWFGVEKLFAYSQIDDHQKYGGVVPEIASRLHSEKVLKVLDEVGLDVIKKVDMISVTTHPWLPGSLVVGKAVASSLAEYFKKPLIQVNHIYGHIFSLWLDRGLDDVVLPMVVLTASGGHNDIYVISDGELKIVDDDLSWVKVWKFKIAKIWQTIDDAAGECFDKVARMLGGPYPGWQWISQKADNYKPWKVDDLNISFKRIFLGKDKFEFSFSGMKSQVWFLLKQLEKNNVEITEDVICKIAYEFQEAVVEVLVKKLIRAWIKYDVKSVGIAGGVSCNERLWQYLNQYIDEKKLEISRIRPVKKVYSTDNAAMIGVVGLMMNWV